MTGRLSYRYASRHGVLLQSDMDGNPRVLCHKDTAPLALAELQRTLGTFPLEMVPEEQFSELLTAEYEQGSPTSELLAENVHDAIDLASLADTLPETEDLMESEDNAPVIQLINAILREAIKRQSSDVHIETYEKRARVRLRVDGVLCEVLDLRRELAPLLVSRIKVMAQLDIAEKRLPQDGRLSLKLGGREVDVRVSTLPSRYCERVVLRLLDKGNATASLGRLGMPEIIKSRFESCLDNPNGIILVTGPTGSGKTTTLYAALGRLNDQSRNILTVEDPVEYAIEGIGQTQVNSKVEMSFAKGLRAILRQDPDVVMVGEIRDKETADIAVQASLTGHLVLSSLHTNSAAATVTRLLDMGVESFLIASTLRAVLAQRLVRQLCSHCRQETSLGHAEAVGMGDEQLAGQQVYTASGCSECDNTGYQGRFGLFELLEVDRAMSALISDNASEAQLQVHQQNQNTLLNEQGRAAVLAGLTSAQEVLRVTRAGS
ncbi:MAG: type II secretion system ATPase GspE [Endozoicomonas sp.]